MSDIPIEVMFEILCELPVKSLLKFRCVSKSWKALIDSPAFVKMHLKSSETKPKIVLCGLSRWCDVSFDKLDTHTRVDVQSFNYPIGSDLAFVWGCCNGLWLVRSETHTVLWNPSTRNYMTLPYKPYYLSEESTYEISSIEICYGLGYDKITDDCKVLRILQGIKNDKYFSQAIVYSLKSHSYRRVKDFPFWISEQRGGTFVFGALHWPVLLPPMANKHMILAFDLGSEEHKCLPLPLHLLTGELKEIRLSVFEGCLSLSCNYECKYVDIWLLRDPGNRDSWAKLFSLKVDVYWSFQVNVKPISYTKCGKYVILEKDEKELLCYDLKLKSVEKYSIFHGPPCFAAFLFSESLLLNDIDGTEVSKLTGQAKKETKKEPPTKKRDNFLSTGFKLKL